VSSRRKPSPGTPEQAIMGDETSAELRADIEALRSSVSDIARQVHAQFTTISAHAEIARQQAEFAREEARADLERTRSLMIDLLERTRRELTVADSQHHVAGTAPGASINAVIERVETLESDLAEMVTSINRCFERQRVLAETVEALFDAVLAEQRNEPVTGLSLI
jgi:hypothetical protein